MKVFKDSLESKAMRGFTEMSHHDGYRERLEKRKNSKSFLFPLELDPLNDNYVNNNNPYRWNEESGVKSPQN